MTSPHRFALASILSIALLLSGCASRPTGPSTFSFGVIGDLQYSAYEEKVFPDLLEALDREPLAFVVHLGDFKSGGDAPCADALYAKRFQELNASKHPLVYTPGDNDWVDCRRASNGGMDPLERLDQLRQVFFQGPKSLGQNPIAVTQQSLSYRDDPVLSRYRENSLWVVHKNNKGVVFGTLNIQGSNDNVGFDAKNDAEQIERTRANLEWLRVALNRARADDIVGVAIFMQANPGFEDKPSAVAASAVANFLRGFETAARAFGKPILFVHGDTHTFRVDRPYVSPLDRRPLGNVTRVEGYGTPNVNWVRVWVDANNSAAPFYVESGGFSAAR